MSGIGERVTLATWAPGGSGSSKVSRSPSLSKRPVIVPRTGCPAAMRFASPEVLFGSSSVSETAPLRSAAESSLR